MALFGDIFSHHHWGRGGQESVTDIFWGGVRDAAKHPTMGSCLLIIKNYSAENVNSVELERPWIREKVRRGIEDVATLCPISSSARRGTPNKSGIAPEGGL